MRTTLIGRLAVGSALALCVSAAPVAVTSSATAAAATPTDGTSKAVLVRSIDLAIAKGLRDGFALSGTDYTMTPSGGDRYLQWSGSVATDPRRGNVRQTGVFKNRIDDLVLYTGPESAYCESGRVEMPNGKPPEFIVRPGVGTWQKLPHRTFPTSAQLKVIGRTKVRWERTADRHTSSAGVVHGSPVVRGMLDEVVEGVGGTSRTLDPYVRSSIAGGGSLYVVPFRSGSGGAGGRPGGVMRVTVDESGALTGFSIVESAFSTRRVTTYTARFGRRGIATPGKSVTASKRHMATACAVVAVADSVGWLSRDAATSLNTAARAGHRSVKPSEIRRFVRSSWTLQHQGTAVRVTSLRFGVKIVGRHKLLEHPVVWTVFVRNGKAVAHRVR